MPLQKRRMGPARIHRRRSAWMRGASRKSQTQECPNCEEPRIAHRVCPNCGFYRGDIVVKVAQDTEE